MQAVASSNTNITFANEIDAESGSRFIKTSSPVSAATFVGRIMPKDNLLPAGYMSATYTIFVEGKEVDKVTVTSTEFESTFIIPIKP